MVVTNDYKMSRREFGKKLIYGLAGTAAGLSLLKVLYAQDPVEKEKNLVKDEEILSKLGEIYRKAKEGRGKNFEYDEMIDVDGVAGKEKVTFLLREDETFTIGTNYEEGERFDLIFNVGGWKKKIYGLVKNGKFSKKTTKTQNLELKDARIFFENVLDHLESES